MGYLASPQTVRANMMEQILDPDTFRAWIRRYARVPMITGKYAYCDGGGTGFNEKGHMVTTDKVVAGYKGWFICRDCAQREYGEAETAIEKAMIEQRHLQARELREAMADG